MSYKIVPFGYQGPLVDEMFWARKRLFVDRLKWDLTVTAEGYEVDNYDNYRCEYLILGEPHEASMRLMRISDPCMTVEAFPGLFDRSMAKDPDNAIEVTRFCVDPWTPGKATELFQAGRDWLYTTEFTSFVAVYTPAMLRVYKRAGWMPNTINSADSPEGKILVGQWSKP